MNNNYEKKIAKLKAKVEADLDDLDNQLELGKLYFVNSEFDKAIETYRQILLKDATKVSAYYNLGMAYQASKMDEQAKQMFRKVLELDPDHKAAQEVLHKILNFKTGG